MSVKSYLAEFLPGTPAPKGSTVFAWAEAQGKARNTVLIQARKLGFVYDKSTDTFVAGAPVVPPEPRKEPAAVAVKDARGARKGFDYDKGIPCEHTVKEWKSFIDAAPMTKRIEGGDMLIYFRDKVGRYGVRYEVYGL